MTAQALLDGFCRAVERRQGAAVAALFTPDGVYHDVFYGSFAGRAQVAELIDDWFYRDATDFRWDMVEPVSDGRLLYARVNRHAKGTPNRRPKGTPSCCAEPRPGRPSRSRRRRGGRPGRHSPTRRGGQARLRNRQLSLPVSTMSQ